MAAVNLSTISSVLATIFDNDITSCINRSSPLLQVLPVKAADSQALVWPASTGTAVPAGAAIAEGTDVSTFNNDTRRKASLTFPTYHDAFSVSGPALAAALAAGNPQALVNLFGAEIMDSASRLGAAIGQHLYSGAGAGSPDQMIGLTATAGGVRATGTYAGIDRSSVTQWRATEMMNSGTPRALTLDLMREMRRRIYLACGKKPDLIVCDPIQHEKYGQLLKEQRRWTQEVTLRGQKITLDGGYQVLEFDGIPIIEDQFAPAGQMLFLNTREVMVRYLPFAGEQDGEMNLRVTPEEQFASDGTQLRAKVLKLARTGDFFKYALFIYPQVQVKAPFTCGLLGDLQS